MGKGSSVVTAVVRVQSLEPPHAVARPKKKMYTILILVTVISLFQKEIVCMSTSNDFKFISHIILCLFFFFLSFVFSRAATMAYGGS